MSLASGNQTHAKFYFEHAASDKPLAWQRYKLKECWMLVLCLVALRGRSGPQVLHNWAMSSSRFTDDFAQRLATKVRPGLSSSDVLMPADSASSVKVLSILPALIIFCLPLRLIMSITRAMTPKQIGVIVVFCDAHLAGFAVSSAMKFRGAETLTLQHGLYRLDDRGSAMCIRNFVSDRILLWDDATFEQLRAAGYDSGRLSIVGQYGFSDPTPSGDVDEQLVLLCPPYQSEKIAHFSKFEERLSKSVTAKWSLHPIRRQQYADRKQAALSTVLPKPKLAICGDSGVLMDALARSIPVITVSERRLASAHLTYDEISSLDSTSFERLSQHAADSLAVDQKAFGFGIPKESLLGLEEGEG